MTTAQKNVALYLRVSTDEQTVENQRQALTEACERRGWRVVAEFATKAFPAPRVAAIVPHSIGCTRRSCGVAPWR